MNVETDFLPTRTMTEDSQEEAVLLCLTAGWIPVCFGIVQIDDDDDD